MIIFIYDPGKCKLIYNDGNNWWLHEAMQGTKGKRQEVQKKLNHF